jgi:SMI1 / KNR4 family (SUKH-1)
MTREEILEAISRALTSDDVRQLNLAARADQISAAQEQLEFEFPLDHRLLLLRSNGLELVGARFWSTEELFAANIEYQFPKFAPWFVAIGSDGGGEAIGYLRATPDEGLYAIPFVGMDQPKRVASSSVDLLLRVAVGGALF